MFKGADTLICLNWTQNVRKKTRIESLDKCDNERRFSLWTSPFICPFHCNRKYVRLHVFFYFVFGRQPLVAVDCCCCRQCVDLQSGEKKALSVCITEAHWGKYYFIIKSFSSFSSRFFRLWFVFLFDDTQQTLSVRWFIYRNRIQMTRDWSLFLRRFIWFLSRRQRT